MKQLTNNSFSKQKGFTLIELVVVIVILGILAATAAPKFIDLTGDARLSVMKGVQGSINSAVNLAHAKALVAGETAEEGAITIGGTAYSLAFGFPSALETPRGLGVDSLIELEDGSDISFDEDATATVPTTVITHSGATDDATCQLTYTDAVNSEAPPVLTATALTAC
jgi:MSHA pilin protein MshA